MTHKFISEYQPDENITRSAGRIVKDLMGEIVQLKADHLREVERLRALLREWYNAAYLGSVCEDFTHPKRDQHEFDEPCAPLNRYLDLCKRTDAELGEK